MPKRRQPPSQPELGLPEVRKLWQTEGLFSDHYLKTRLPQSPWWPTDAEAKQPPQRFQPTLRPSYSSSPSNLMPDPNAQMSSTDLLAFLAERMMALNKDKRTAARQFFTNLRDFHGIDAHALKPKTKLDEFWKPTPERPNGLEPADLFGHFRANKLRLSAADEEKIRARFQKAKARLQPLETQLAFTDGLIDQIVYRLYGLTDEEIRLVETAMASQAAGAPAEQGPQP